MIAEGIPRSPPPSPHSEIRETTVSASSVSFSTTSPPPAANIRSSSLAVVGGIGDQEEDSRRKQQQQGPSAGAALILPGYTTPLGPSSASLAAVVPVRATVMAYDGGGSVHNYSGGGQEEEKDGKVMAAVDDAFPASAPAGVLAAFEYDHHASSDGGSGSAHFPSASSPWPPSAVEGDHRLRRFHHPVTAASTAAVRRGGGGYDTMNGVVPGGEHHYLMHSAVVAPASSFVAPAPSSAPSWSRERSSHANTNNGDNGRMMYPTTHGGESGVAGHHQYPRSSTVAHKISSDLGIDTFVNSSQHHNTQDQQQHYYPAASTRRNSNGDDIIDSNRGRGQRKSNPKSGLGSIDPGFNHHKHPPSMAAAVAHQEVATHHQQQQQHQHSSTSASASSNNSNNRHIIDPSLLTLDMTSYGNLKDAIVAVKVFLENVRHLAVERGLFAEEEESSIGKKQSPPLFVTIVTGEGGSGSPGTILRSVLQKIFRNREINYFFDDYSGATANTTAGLLFRVDALSGIQDDEPPPPRSRRDGGVSSPSLHHRYKPQDQMDQHHPMNNNPSSIEENNNSSNHQHHGSGSFNHPTNTPHLSPRLSPHLNSSSTFSSQHCQQQPRLAATAAAAATAVDDPSQQQPLPTSLIPQHDETSSPYLRRWSSSSSSPYLPHQHKSQHHQATAPTNNPEEHCYYPQDYQGSAGMVHNPLDSIAAHTTPLPLRDLTRSGKSSSGGSSSSAVSTDHYNALSGIGAPKLLAMPYGDGGRAGGGGYCPSSSQQQQQQSPLAAASLEPQVEAALRAARFIQATQNLYRAHVPQEVRNSTGNNNDSSSGGGGGGNIISHHHQERQRGRGGSTTNSSLSERMLPMDSRAIPSTTTEAAAAITPPSRPAATTTRRHTSHSTPHQSPPHWHHGSGGQQQQQQRRRNSYDNTDNNSESQIQQAILESQAAHMAHTRRQVMDDIQFRKEVELARNESSRDVLPRHHDGEAEEEEVDQEHQLIQMASRRSIDDEQSRQIEQEKKYELDLELALKASEHVHSLQQKEYQRFKESEDELIADLLVKSQAEEEEARKKEEEMIQLTLVKSLAENGNVKEEELIEEIMKKSLSDSDPNSCCRGSSDGEYFMNGKTDRSEGDAAAAAGNGDHQDNMLERILKLSLEDNEKVAAEEAEQIKQAMEWSMMEARCYENNDHHVLDDHQVGDSET